MSPQRIAIAGCGRVSRLYLDDLRGCPHAEVVAVADANEAAARERAAAAGLDRWYATAEAMIDEVEFDILLNTTAMPAHYPICRRALAAGRHVYCEKPLAGSLDEALELVGLARAAGVTLLGAPNVVCSPAYAALARLVDAGELGDVHAAHAIYGHGGPTWGPWFYRAGGGALFDLAVYNLTTLTGLLGPAATVTASCRVAVPERVIDGETVRVEAEDNAAVVVEHVSGAVSVTQTGFVYGRYHEDRTVELIGRRSSAALLGWDWAPRGVEVWDEAAGAWTTVAADQRGYAWQQGAAHLAECLATGRRSPMSADQAVHVLELMLGAQAAARDGRRRELTTSFEPPPVG